MRKYKVKYVMEFEVEADTHDEAHERAKNHMLLPAGFRHGEDFFEISEEVVHA